MTKKLRGTLILIVVALIVASPALAGRAEVGIDAGLVTFQIAKAQLRITGPAGFLHEGTVDGAYSLAPVDKAGAALADGVYSWELTPIAPRVKRGEAPRAALEAHSGHFAIRGGAFVVPTGGVSRQDVATKDIIHADDVIINGGSLCVGFDCVNGESFGFDTIRLKENNLRIKFEDTSAGTFPSNDWQLTANDSASGGASKFSIEDITGARVPMTITAGATTNSIFVDSSGRVGFRTSTPVLDLHVNTSNTPALRLEQNNSGGFSAQTWDVAGNEANFFVRDVTSGSRLPFRLIPGAPTSSLVVASDGDVGMGVLSPTGALHVSRSLGGAAEMLRVSNNGGTFFTMANTSTADDWFFTHQNADAGSFIIDSELNDVADGPEFTLTPAGNLTLSGTLTITGGCTGCDAVLSPEWKLESIEDHASAMWSNSYLPAVGPTPEGTVSIDVFQKTTGILQELEKAHIYIEQLNARLSQLEAALAAK